MDFKPESLIINRPDLVPPGQKMTAWGITLMFWAGLLYLWQPLLSILAWGLNIRLFYNHMILLGGYQTFLSLLVFYLAVIAALGGGLVLWGRINQWRFRGKERRLDIGATDLPRLYASFGVEQTDWARAIQHKVVVVSFAEDGSDIIAAIAPQESVSGDFT